MVTQRLVADEIVLYLLIGIRGSRRGVEIHPVVGDRCDDPTLVFCKVGIHLLLTVSDDRFCNAKKSRSAYFESPASLRQH